MSQPRASAPPGLPTWLVVLGSLAVAVHLLAVGVASLTARSGLWWTLIGPTPVEPPPFASALNAGLGTRYLKPLRLMCSYRYSGNRPPQFGVFVEITLKDDDGAPIKKVTVPDPEANFWVRHRQQQLAQALTMDRNVDPPGTEPIAGPGQKMPTQDIWDLDGPNRLRLRTVPVHLVPRDREVMKPSDLGMALARSYVRYLCRMHGAASGELVRHTRRPIYPHVLFQKDLPPDTFSTLVANFGEFSR